jgi:hypothetical protein
MYSPHYLRATGITSYREIRETLEVAQRIAGAGRSQEFKQLLGDCIYRVMQETMNVPSGFRFQVIIEHDPWA